MEAALVSGLLKLALDKLVPLISSGFASLMGVKKDLCELQRLFEEITSRLSAVGDKVTDKDPSFHWVKDLKDVAYDFDDLLYHLEAEKHKADVDGDKHVMAVSFVAKPKSALSRVQMAQRIKKIKKKFAKIVKQRTDVNAIAESLAVQHPIQHRNKTIGEMSILVNIDETKVLGRDKAKHEIVSKLVEADTREKISIVSVVGLGGSGKTTLAKYICQDKKIKEHFDDTWWVHVSQEFNVEMLIRKLCESVSGKKSELNTLQHMTETISEKLSGRKFLLVLDDIWNEDQHDWEQFKQHFNSGASGSKILLTTRDRKVAETVKSTDIVSLAFLSDDDSWKLFQQSSGWAEEGLDSEFIEVGKEIVKKCAGVPLAIKSLAGVLHGKREIKEWQTFRDSNLLNDLNIQDRVLGSLTLSYFHLCDDLKQCFLLCSLFPKGYSIYKDHLISQWIAHGFVNPMNEGRRSEDIGSDYFDSLLKVSFLQDLDKDKDTGRLRCKMHDLVHDLTRRILQDEIVLRPKKTTTNHSQRCRYLSIASCTEKVDRKLFNKVRALYVTGGIFATDKPIKKGRCVRSVILEDIKSSSFHLFVLKFEYLGYLRMSGVDCTELPCAISDCWNLQALHITGCHRFAMLPESIGKLKKLRTLELSNTMELERLPQSIGDCHCLESLHLISCWKFREIPHSIAKNEKLRVLNIVNCQSLCQLPSESFACDELRTLELSRTKLTVLPQCITSLSNLEHLDLGCCQELVELPEGIGNLKRLNILNLEGCYKLRGLPAGFGQLTRLRKLASFVIGHRSEHARISELRNLDMISGVLEIEGVGYVKDPYDAEKAFLKKKNNIQTMILDWFWTSNRTFLNGLEPPSRIKASAEDEVDMEVEQELTVLNGLEPPSRIKYLEIRNYQGLHLPCWMTKERHSSSLDRKFKQTVDVPCFHHLTNMELACFPRLKHLSGLGGLPSLESLILSRFDALESISSGPLPSLTHLNIFGMPYLVELSMTTRIALADEDGVIVCGNQEVQCFPRLSTLYIADCPKLNAKLWSLASLESLRLIRCNEQLLFPVQPHGDESESTPSCSNSDGVSSCLSLLKELVLEGMTGRACSLEIDSLEIESRDELRQLPESMRSLTSLQYLQISSCSGLRGLPEWLGELRSLQSLRIFYCDNLRQFPEGIQQLTSLKYLCIQWCRALHQLPECLWELHSLQWLEISRCENLRLLEGLGGLRSLRRLYIKVLPTLSCLPESMRGLISLERLEIHSCDALHRLPDQIGELRSLQSLQLWDLPALTCLPESMERLTSLHNLFIIRCDALTVLPESIGQLSALRSLVINSCHGLAFLPRSIERLTSLQELCIVGNPDLARRYNQGEGEDWHLISHIPDVEIQ